MGTGSQRWLEAWEMGCVMQASPLVERGSKYLEENRRQAFPREQSHKPEKEEGEEEAWGISLNL